MVLRVKDIMTKKVIVLKPNDNIKDAIHKLVKYDIYSLPVVDEKKKLVGLVTEGDIIRSIDAYFPVIRHEHENIFAIVLAILDAKKDEFSAVKDSILRGIHIKVSDVMNRCPKIIGPNENVYEAVKRMNKYKVRVLPVIDKNQRLLGIIARQDIIRELGK